MSGHTAVWALAFAAGPLVGAAQTPLPLGVEFRVNSYTTNSQYDASAAAHDDGSFVVVWTSSGQDGSARGVFGRRYAASGAALGDEFAVNTYTTDNQQTPAVASDGAGSFVVVWSSYRQDGDHFGIFGRRYDATGDPLGSEFPVNSYSTSSQSEPAVAFDGTGNFVVV